MTSKIHIALALTLTLVGLTYFGYETFDAIRDGNSDRLTEPLLGSAGLVVGMTIVWFGEKAMMKSRSADRTTDKREPGA